MQGKEKQNSYYEFITILSKVEEILGKEGLLNMHMHISGIEYDSNGEKKHLTLKESDFNYSELLAALKEFKITGMAICESPNLEEDGLLLRNIYYK